MTQAQANTCEQLNPWGRNGYFEILSNGLVKLTVHGKGVHYIAKDGTVLPTRDRREAEAEAGPVAERP